MPPDPAKHDHSHPKPPFSSDIAAEAAGWLSRKLRSGSFNAQDERNFQAWLHLSPLHEAEFRKAEEAMQLTAMAESLPSLESEISRVLGKHQDTTDRRSALKRIGWTVAGLGASGAAAAGIMAWTTPGVDHYETGIAEHTSITLPDGSVVDLDAMSRLEVRFSREWRRVSLITGRATFSVTSDAERPFIVQADTRRVQVVGTVFEVHLIPEAPGNEDQIETVEVSVQEGAVKVQAAGPVSSETDLSPGIRAVWKVEEPSPELSSFPLESFGEWRSGRLTYRERPFRYVLADLQREYGGDIILKDSELGRLTVNATLRTRELSQSFQLLQEILPIIVLQPERGTIVIERRPER